jgi:hypothetical protein
MFENLPVGAHPSNPSVMEKPLKKRFSDFGPVFKIGKRCVLIGCRLRKILPAVE